MAVSVTHAKVSTVPDDGDASEVLPSDWNAAHTVTGLGTAAEQDASYFATAADPTFTGVASFPDGSASAPSITHTGDANTGLYFGTDIINFATAGTFAAMVDATQRFVVGHTTAIAIGANTSRFQTHGTTQATSQNAYFRWSADSAAPSLGMAKSRNATPGSHTIVQAEDQLFNLVAYGSDGSAFINAGGIRVLVDTTPGTNDMPGRVSFFTTADGASTPTERLRIDSAGAMIHRNNAQQIVDANSHLQLRSYTVAGLPSAATAGQLIYVSNETGGATPAFSDGTNWRRVADRAIVS